MNCRIQVPKDVTQKQIDEKNLLLKPAIKRNCVSSKLQERIFNPIIHKIWNDFYKNFCLTSFWPTFENKSLAISPKTHIILVKINCVLDLCRYLIYNQIIPDRQTFHPQTQLLTSFVFTGKYANLRNVDQKLNYSRKKICKTLNSIHVGQIRNERNLIKIKNGLQNS